MPPLPDPARLRIILGDCVEVMAALEAESVDAVVCDPPYSLGFMGRAWDSHGGPTAFQAWCEAWGRQVFRVLKPGGHVLAFGGTRTYHRLASGLEDAGFEVRDSLHWIYGSGFPKSHDVSKAIDKKLGGEREIVGSKDVSRVLQGSGDLVGGNVRAGSVAAAPATEEAAEWEGWGTALKPAHEPIILARKPLGGTVAENVLETRHWSAAH